MSNLAQRVIVGVITIPLVLLLCMAGGVYFFSFIAVVSANSQARLEGYFRREWWLAVERSHEMADGRHFLLPVVIDDTSEADAHVPEAFRAVQWTRLNAGEVNPAFAGRIANHAALAFAAKLSRDRDRTSAVRLLKVWFPH